MILYPGSSRGPAPFSSCVKSTPDRHRLWTLRLAIATSAFVLIMTLSGLSIWLLPFSLPNQVLVYVHTVLGVALLAPVTWYSLRHWLAYRGNQMTHIKLLGYPHVARPEVAAQEIKRRSRKPGERAAVLPRELPQEMLRQKRDVLWPLLELRQMNVNHVEPVE